ncbi:MAG: hypothetical protein ACOX0U_07605 [Oscillospiraceae bacterium]|jgi:hypothetical protein
MKKGVLLSVVTLAAGLAGAVLRWMERETGFEEGTGLALPGNGPAIVLVALTCLLAVFLIVVSVKIKYEPYFWYDKASLTQSALCFGAYCAAALLMAGVGGIFAWKALSGDAVSLSRLILGAFAVGTATALLLTAKGNYKEREKGRYRFRLLVPPFFCCYWLILAYERRAANPTVLQYVYELFAIICALLAFYYIAGFDFGRARLRRGLFFGQMAGFFSIVTLADGHAAESVLLYAAVTLYLLVYLGALLGQMERTSLLTP